MRVLLLEPQRNPYPKEIRGDTASLTQAVGGDLDTLYFDAADRAIIFCNGYPAGLLPNRIIDDQMIQGTFIIAGQTMTADGAAACSLTESQIEQYRRMFSLQGADVAQEQIRGILGSLSEDEAMQQIQ